MADGIETDIFAMSGAVADIRRVDAALGTVGVGTVFPRRLCERALAAVVLAAPDRFPAALADFDGCETAPTRFWLLFSAGTPLTAACQRLLRKLTDPTTGRNDPAASKPSRVREALCSPCPVDALLLEADPRVDSITDQIAVELLFFAREAAESRARR